MSPPRATVAGPVLVTGAAGFAGRHLVRLLSGTCELIGWARSAPAADLGSLARWYEVDLRDRDRVRTLIRELRPARIFHLAGSAHVGESTADPAKAFANNVLATHHLFDALRRAAAGSRVVVAGSAAVYASSDAPLDEDAPIGPANPYALSKFAQEELGRRAILEDGLDVIVTRPFNHTGPGQSASYMAPSVARQIAMIERGQLEPVLRIGNTRPMRDVSDVRDVVRAYDALMHLEAPAVIYNVASGIGRSVQQILDTLLGRARVDIRIEVDPERLRSNDPPMLVGDASRLTAATGWVPEIPFEQTVTELLDYWRTQTAAS